MESSFAKATVDRLWKYGNGVGIRALAVCIITYSHIFTFAYSATPLPSSPGFEASADGRFTWGGRDEHLAVVNPVVAADEERGNVMSLRGEWEFVAEKMRSPWRNGGPWLKFYRAKWENARKINVPGCWEAQGVGEPGMSECWDAVWDNSPKPIRHKYMGDGWYRKTVKIPAAWTGKRVWLKIGGVKSKGWFWVNNRQVALVDNYCGTCKYEITDLVKPGDDATIVVQVNNVQPSRKGMMSFVHKWGGLYRDVEIEATPQTFIDDAWVRGLFDEKAAEVHVAIGRAVSPRPPSAREDTRPPDTAVSSKPPYQIRVTIDGQMVAKTLVQKNSQLTHSQTLKLPLSSFRPWSPEHPNLYTARVDLVENGNVVHSRLERFGVRKYEVRGKEFYLNGKPFFVRGFGDDFVYPITGMTPPDREVHRAHLAKARAAGFNYVRLHTHCEIPEYFEAADELGIMVQPELPYYSDVQTEGAEFDPRRDVTELWRNYRRHPSFAVYSMGNEGSYGAELDAQMHKFIKNMDPDRLKINQDSNMPSVNPPEASDYLGGPIKVWPRGSFDPDRPFVAHEYLNLCVKQDSRDEAKYDGVWMPPAPRSKRLKWLASRGLGEGWCDALQDAQHALQRHYQKRGVEWARKDQFCDGYIFWTVVDVVVGCWGTYSAQGLFNPFWEQKRGGLSATEFAKFNSPMCVLLDTPDESRVFTSGDELPVDFLFANYGDAPLKDAILEWRLDIREAGERDARPYLVEAVGSRVPRDRSGRVRVGDIPLGPVRRIASEKIVFPAVEKPAKAVLTVSVGDVENSWDFWVFPKRAKRDGRNLAVASSLVEAMSKLYEGFEVFDVGTVSTKSSSAREDTRPPVVVAEGGSPEAESALKAGRRVVAIGKTDGKPNVSLGWWTMGSQVGTALRKHPVFGDLPHEGVLSPLLFRIVCEGKSLDGSKRRAEDLFMVGEGAADCYLYLARRREGDGVAIESFGLDLLSGTPEGAAILDGMIAVASSGVNDVAKEDDAAKMGAAVMNPGSRLPCVGREAGGMFKVLVYGNSIALHCPLPAIGWTNTWGMAASAAEKDFAHLVVAGLETRRGEKADFRVRNIAALERNFATNLADVAEIADDSRWMPNYVVIAIGENVKSLDHDKAAAYRRFLADLAGMFASASNRPAVVMRSPFWRNAVKDECTARAADDVGAVFVDAGRLGDKDENKAIGRFDHRGVANHPGDLGMRRIADAILDGFDRCLIRGFSRRNDKGKSR